jgi:DNA-binding XRE family transcriptional regulator
MCPASRPDRKADKGLSTGVCFWGIVCDMDAVRAQLASNIRRHRRKAGLTQERLAEVCDLHRTAIGLLERGKRSPLLDTLVILARGLELSSPADLLEGISCAPTDDGSADA